MLGRAAPTDARRMCECKRHSNRRRQLTRWSGDGADKSEELTRSGWYERVAKSRKKDEDEEQEAGSGEWLKGPKVKKATCWPCGNSDTKSKCFPRLSQSAMTQSKGGWADEKDDANTEWQQ